MLILTTIATERRHGVISYRQCAFHNHETDKVRDVVEYAIRRYVNENNMMSPAEVQAEIDSKIDLLQNSQCTFNGMLKSGEYTTRIFTTMLDLADIDIILSRLEFVS